jgi:hypothetical protein
MKLHRWIASAALVASLAMAGVAQAAAPAPITLQSDIKVEKTVVQAGIRKVILVPARRTVPGNRLLITNSYHNISAARIENFIVTNPVPKGVVYTADATDKGEVSVDGGKSWGQLAALTVPAANGVRRPAQASDVTHVRWIVSVIAPGAEGTVSYHAVVR